MPTKKNPPSIVKGVVETFAGRYWQEIEVIENGESRWEFFSDCYVRGVELKATARIRELMGELKD